MNGANFIAASSVRWNGSPRSTTYLSATQVKAAITAADVASSGSASVTVFNPAPGGGVSNAQTLTIAAPRCTSATMTTNPAGQAGPGAPVTLTVLSVSGCPNPQYAYWVAPPAGGWQLLQTWTSAGAILWNTSGLAPGVYILDIWARDAASLNAGYDTYTYLYFTLSNACTADSMSTTPASPATAGTPVRWTVQSSGCPNPQYAYWVSPPSGGWQLLQTWTSASSFTWNTTSLAPGVYILDIWARDASTGPGYDTYTYTYFTVQ